MGKERYKVCRKTPCSLLSQTQLHANMQELQIINEGPMVGKKPSADTQQNSAKDKALESILGQIERQYGKGAVMMMGDGTAEKLRRFPRGR